MAPPASDRPSDRDDRSILVELYGTVEDRWAMAERLDDFGDRPDVDDLVDVVRHAPVIEAFHRQRRSPLDHRDIEERLDVSRATSHRFTRWLTDEGYAERVPGGFRLTGKGEVVAEELLRFQWNLRAAGRLEPLLTSICEDHQEFVVEPFADATVTEATPADPYGPVRRFRELLAESSTLRGFNVTPMVPLFGADGDDALDGVDTELVHLPEVVETLLAEGGGSVATAVERGSLALRTREAFPYGLVLFDEGVGVGGYDEHTGTMQVFVDTDSAVARDWAERVYAAVRADSDPVELHDAVDAESAADAE